MPRSNPCSVQARKFEQNRWKFSSLEIDLVGLEHARAVLVEREHRDLGVHKVVLRVELGRCGRGVRERHGRCLVVDVDVDAAVAARSQRDPVRDRLEPKLPRQYVADGGDRSERHIRSVADRQHRGLVGLEAAVVVASEGDCSERGRSANRGSEREQALHRLPSRMDGPTIRSSKARGYPLSPETKRSSSSTGGRVGLALPDGFRIATSSSAEERLRSRPSARSRSSTAPRRPANVV